jgi:hypothetical protein
LVKEHAVDDKRGKRVPCFEQRRQLHRAGDLAHRQGDSLRLLALVDVEEVRQVGATTRNRMVEPSGSDPRVPL